jgi:short-subunit dehydrogenase involved in D-alanine esterification of teichoic acids
MLSPCSPAEITRPVFFVAGIQHRLDLAKGKDLDFDAFHEELNVNYISLVTLAQLFVPHMQAQAKKGKQATLATVTSGLAFVPMPSVALYCATKAAVRSYTISCVLRSVGRTR